MHYLAKLCVNRPVLAVVIILALVVAGVFSIPKLGAELYPDVEFPNILITTKLPGAMPDAVESQVTNEIEKQVNAISGIEFIESSSTEGYSIVSIQFNLDKDVNVAAQEVQSKVNLAEANLPHEAEKPIVQKDNIDGFPVVQIALTSPTASNQELSEYADKKLRPQLETISGVGGVDLVGDQKRVVDVQLDPTRLKAFDLTAVDIAHALSSENIQAPAGDLDQGARKISVRTEGRATRLSQLETIIVCERAGQPVYLRDVAKVVDSHKDKDTEADINGGNAILLKISRQSGANAIQIVDDIRLKMSAITRNLPAGYSARIVTDQSTYIRSSLHAVEEHLVVGAFLAALVVLIFLRDWRSTVISALSIPASILATFSFLKIGGMSLNIITLLSLTLVVGIVIDDTIIVLENIKRYIDEKGYSPREAALEATREIGTAVMATTLSLLSVFLPIAFMTGVVGRFLHSFGLAMSAAIAVSLIVAFTTTPMLSSKWLKSNRGTPESKAPSALNKITTKYGQMLRWTLAHRWVVAVSSLFIFALSGPLIMVLPKNFMPDDDKSQFLLSARLPEGASGAETQEVLDRIASDIQKLPEVTDTVVTVGADNAQTINKGEIMVQMTPVDERKSKTNANDLMQRVRNEILPKYPQDLRVIVSPPSDFNAGVNADVTYVIYGPDLNLLTRTGEKMVQELKATPGIADADTSAISGKPEIKVDINRPIAANLGVSTSDIARTLRILLSGEEVSGYDEGGQHYDIYLRSDPNYRQTSDKLALFNIPTSKDSAQSVPLSEVTSTRMGAGPSLINRYNRARCISIEMNMLPGVSEQAIHEKIQQFFAAEKLGPQYRGDFQGESAELSKMMLRFGLAFALSIIFMYMVLAAQFESWLHPLTIMATLPITLPFALITIYVLGQSLNTVSLLGMLVLIGVVMKNAILVVDQANQLQAKGMSKNEAIINASKGRLRPILMTTIAFVAGMLPLALSRGAAAATNQAASSVVIGGQTLVLALTLFCTPVFYSLMDDLSARLSVKKKRVE
jgi:HAE1 family hydrophobic/amphiphilic exporter-1